MADYIHSTQQNGLINLVSLATLSILGYVLDTFFPNHPPSLPLLLAKARLLNIFQNVGCIPVNLDVL